MVTLALALEPSDGPVFLRIARALSRDIRRGRLRPGALLPGSRSLAASLGVHRNTVLAAYRELDAEGWIETQPARATRVKRELPEERPLAWGARATRRRLKRASETLGFDLPAAPTFASLAGRDPVVSSTGSGPIALYGGLPELGSFPIVELTRAYRRAATAERGAPLGYGDPMGEPALRAAVAAFLSSTRGVVAEVEDVFITRGSQMALFLAAAVLLRPGDVVAVEARGYAPAWAALRASGAELVPIPVDDEGLDVERLATLARARPIRAVYLTPHHQYPTTRLLSPARRLALLELCEAHRMIALEDDYDHEFHYDGRPVLPLASADVAGSVVYFGTFSKVLAPSLRLGFVVAPRPVLRAMCERRVLVDRQGDRLLELAVAELFEGGEVVRHVRRMRRLYHARREAMANGLDVHFGERARFTLPPGGMAIWSAFEGVDVELWATRAAERGVLLHTGRRFAFDGRPSPHLRLGFAGQSEARIEQALARMRQCLPPRPGRGLRAARG
ncbi:MAG: PLP-dependent aminotransferase family protein [Polyangiaceae bacterium]